MTVIQDTEYRKNIEDLTEYFEKAKDAPSLLTKISEDPLGVLQSMNISVEDKFKEAVTSQLRAASSTASPQPHKREVELMSEQVRHLSGSEVVATPMSASAETPPEVLDAVQFLVKPWGLVLVVREPAIKYLQGGGTISASVLGGIAAVAGVTGPLGIAVGLIVGICAAALGVFSGVINIMDRGKGVYLTWTWAQFLPFLIPPFIPNPMYGIPVVTPI